MRAAGPWWQAFGSPELDGAIRQALSDSPTLAEAQATLERSQAEARAVHGGQLPQVDANASAQRQQINLAAFGFSGFPGQPPLPNPLINLYSVGGGVSYDLDLFGGKRRATEQANARAESAARQADAAYLTLTGSVAIQAMRIASLRAQIAALQEVIAGDQQVLDMVRKAQAAGGEAKSAISGGVAWKASADDQALLPPLQRELDAARHQMALLAGKSPAEFAAPDFDLARLTMPADVPVSLAVAAGAPPPRHPGGRGRHARRPRLRSASRSPISTRTSGSRRPSPSKRCIPRSCSAPIPRPGTSSPG